MVLVVVAGVMAGAAVGPHPGWVLATTIAVTVLAAALLRGAHRPAGSHGPAGSRSSPPSSRSPAQGVLALAVLGLAGAGVAGARAAAVHHGVLIGMAARGGTVMVDATVAEEPDTVRYGGRWVVLSVRRVEVAGQAWRTRERVGVILPGTAGTIAVGDRLRVAAGVERSNRTDPLGGEPATVLRRPRVVSRSPSRSWLLRVSEAVRAAARQRALDSLPPERAGLLVGIALGDTSLEPAELDRAFTTAGLTHLTAVSGQNLAVVLAAGLGIAVALRASRPLLAGLGIVLIVLFALLTRWEPSVLRASAMAVLALLGVATGRGPGGRRALCLAVTLLLLANPALVSSLGFRLSVAATAGVLWLGPTATRVLPGRLPHVVRSAIGISLGAQAGATPVLALAFGQVSMAGLAANLVAVPLKKAAIPYRSPNLENYRARTTRRDALPPLNVMMRRSAFMPSNNTQQPAVEPLLPELPAWRKAAIRRCVETYDGNRFDPENTDGIVIVDYRASETERAAALLELLEEIFPEAAHRIRARGKVAAKVVTAVCMVRLNEIALQGRQFVPISNKAYAWRPKTQQRTNGRENSTKAPARQQQSTSTRSRRQNLRPVNKDNARYDREFDGKPRPWVPDENDLEEEEQRTTRKSNATRMRKAQQEATKTRQRVSQPATTSSKGKAASRPQKGPEKPQRASRAPSKAPVKAPARNRAAVTDEAIRKIIEKETAKDRKRTTTTSSYSGSGRTVGEPTSAPKAKTTRTRKTRAA